MKSKAKLHTEDIAAAAKRLLGFPSLRPGQEKAIRSLLQGHDTLVVQPTGSGKSAIPDCRRTAEGRHGGCLAPHRAAKGSGRRDRRPPFAGDGIVNSTFSTTEQRETFERIEQGSAKYIFLAPEQLKKPETIARLQSAKVSLIAIDEAHCVGQWGYDFRPDYLEIARGVEARGSGPLFLFARYRRPGVQDGGRSESN